METYTYHYPKPSVTTDCILMKNLGKGKEILLIKRKDEPFKGKWALPGGFVEKGEDLEEGANRELNEETGISKVSLKQFKTFGKPGRDPRGWTISVVFYGFISQNIIANAGDDASEVAWFNIQKLPPLAFDHNIIIEEFMNDHL